MQTKTTTKASPHTGQNGCHLKSLLITNIRKGMEKMEPSYTVSGNVNCVALWKTVCTFLKKLGTKLSYDPAIPLLGICLGEKTVIQKDACTPMFISQKTPLYVKEYTLSVLRQSSTY